LTPQWAWLGQSMGWPWAAHCQSPLAWVILSLLPVEAATPCGQAFLAAFGHLDEARAPCLNVSSLNIIDHFRSELISACV
jgi:hypothetical protein